MSSVEYINSLILTASQSNVTFSNIPQNYTDLILTATGATSVLQNLIITYNNISTGGLYSYNLYYSYGATTGAYRSPASINNFQPDYYASFDSPNIGYIHLDIQNYSNTSIFKTTIYKSGCVTSASAANHIGSSAFRSTNAISTINISAQTNTFSSGSSFQLWGIK